MEQKIINSANSYRDKAQKLEDFRIDIGDAKTIPANIAAAMIKLYLAKELETGLEKCQDFLNEETAPEVFEAIQEAARAIENAADIMFEQIDLFANENPQFTKMIEGLSVNSGEDSLEELLLKLYKCEGIIRMAYRCAKKFPIYGVTMSWERQMAMDSENASNTKDALTQETGIDMNELYEIRLGLITHINELRNQMGF